MNKPLDGHTEESHAKVFKALETYRDTMALLDDDTDDATLLSFVKDICEELNAINEAHGSGLLETDEREMIVPFINDVAVMKGLDVTRFAYGDPTEEYREF
ncbi:MAG: hypothetical protein AAF674_03930 [Pseudomonadota bacterium]